MKPFYIGTTLTSLLLIITVMISGCTSSTGVVTENEKTEPIFLADPTIFYHDGTYYLYGTGAPNGFLVYTSRDLENWEGPKGVSEGLALKKGEAFGTRGFWAPQIFEYNDKFYMAYTANESIAIAHSESPLGPFVQDEQKALEAPVRQIDPFIFIDDDGKKYLYHVRVADGANRIYVAEINDELTAIKPETLKECITATQHWEDTENAKWKVTEGPTVLKRDGLYYLIYSANHFKSKDYAVGYAVSDNPYGPWKKHENNPILSRNNVNEPGAGHGDFFLAEDDLYYVFHTHNSDSTIGPRKTALVDAEFTKDGDTDVIRIKPDSFKYLTVPEEDKQ